MKMTKTKFTLGENFHEKFEKSIKKGKLTGLIDEKMQGEISKKLGEHKNKEIME